MPLQEFKGLTGAEVSRLQAEVGFNELPASGPRGIWRIAREVMQEPMFILLMGCSSLYLVLGDYREGLIMICSVLVIILITFLQHRKTERSLEALRQLASPRALVVRNGVELRIAGREVVPGDILLLHEGDRVPADARILECSFLCVDESLLTGESVAVQKDKSDPALDSVFSGTLVVKGSGVAEVLAT
ncbi:MAG: HAD-IC family P-type ATPase, partial [Bacteroidota bacterium]